MQRPEEHPLARQRRRGVALSALLLVISLSAAGCGSSNKTDSSPHGLGAQGEAFSAATAQSAPLVDCVHRVAVAQRSDTSDRQFKETSAGETNPLQMNPAPIPGARYVFTEGDLVKPAYLDLYVFPSEADARAAEKQLLASGLKPTNSDLNLDSVGVRGPVLYHVFGEGSDTITDGDAINCLGPLPKPKGAAVPAAIAPQAQGLQRLKLLAGPTGQAPTLPDEAKVHPDILVEFTSPTAIVHEVEIAYFASSSKWQQAVAHLKAYNKTQVVSGGLSASACGQHRIYVFQNDEAPGTYQPVLKAAESSTASCQVVP